MNHEQVGRYEPLTIKNLLEVVAALGAAVGFFYSLGLLLLATQIWFTYELSFESTWYAATLVPDKVVFGQGIRVLMVSPVILIGITIFAFHKTGYGIKSQQATESAAEKTKLYMAGRIGFRKKHVYLILFFLAFLFGLACFAAARVYLLKGDPAAYTSIVRSVLTTAICVITVYVAIVLSIHCDESGTSYLGKLGSLFLLFYVMGFMNAIVSGQLANPPLTKVKIAQTQGQLLAHSDGYWHLIKPDGDMVSVSDDEAKSVTVGKN